ncbi:MAG: lysylphosphatidylglycerol synthase transmembrane domain-containing protein [Candidatus Omnitrophica bacterium]|nr:lysylphosphatidylglycerol synthase transmembrane domain-containing protein [Candidatus Omnitrophota bacterium]MDD5487349.1 lysylphosphatidylglycerol synthase transmembrane domain-containing protein [Candidatus Omnitrophota bacterium]
MSGISGKISALLRTIVSFGLLGLLFWLMRDEIRGIYKIILSCPVGYLVVAAILFSMNIVMLAYRLKLIFFGEDLKLNMTEALQLTLIGYFFNNFMPTAVGGDIIKAHYATYAHRNRIRTYASVFMDRIIGFYAFFIVAGVALAFNQKNIELSLIRPLVFTLIFLGIVGFVVVTNRRIALALQRFFSGVKMLRLGEKLNAVYCIVHDYRNRVDVVLKALGVSIVSQSIYFLVVYVLFSALGAKVDIMNLFLIMPVVTFISMIPSVGGLGVREGAIVALFSPITGKETAFAVSLLLLLGLMAISVLGGVVCLLWGVSGIKKTAGDRVDPGLEKGLTIECSSSLKEE